MIAGTPRRAHRRTRPAARRPGHRTDPQDRRGGRPDHPHGHPQHGAGDPPGQPADHDARGPHRLRGVRRDEGAAHRARPAAGVCEDQGRHALRQGFPGVGSGVAAYNRSHSAGGGAVTWRTSPPGSGTDSERAWSIIDRMPLSRTSRLKSGDP